MRKKSVNFLCERFGDDKADEMAVVKSDLAERWMRVHVQGT